MKTSAAKKVRVSFLLITELSFDESQFRQRQEMSDIHVDELISVSRKVCF